MEVTKDSLLLPFNFCYFFTIITVPNAALDEKRNAPCNHIALFFPVFPCPKASRNG